MMALHWLKHPKPNLKYGVQRTPGRFDIVFDDMMTIYQKLGLYCAAG